MDQRLVDELHALDVALYRAVAATPTPSLDRWLQPLTSAADHSKLWMASAAALAAAGGPRGRRAAAEGLVAVALASAVVNQGLKRAWRRDRPDRSAAEVPAGRVVDMPTSTSFPSGHAASAFAFAGGATHAAPAVGIPLHAAAAVVAYSRVHSGVHYPGDVIAGALTGIACARLAPPLVRGAVRALRAKEGQG